jgi:hypothetical protein
MRLVPLALCAALAACGGSSPAAQADAATDAAVGDDARDGGAVGDAVPEDAPLPDDAANALCETYGPPVQAGQVAESALTELSGLAASRRNPGVYYAHNDSGDTARFFALSATGEALGVFTLSATSATDWEDIAVGPCPTGWCVHLGDIGDNAVARTGCAVIRVAEPEVAAAVGEVTVTAERFPFVYPDGAHNAETLLVHPLSGDVYVVSKVAATPSKVYRYPAPLQAGATVTLEHVADVTVPAGSLLVTGGDIHPTGARLLLRTYDHLWELRGAPGADFAALLAATPLSVPVATETQGEAVAYTVDGLGYVTASEGSGPPLYRTDCVAQ